MKKITLLIFALISSSFGDIKVSQVPPKVVLSGDNGGHPNGKAWSSSTLKGRMFVVLYVDPDEMKTNKKIISILDKYRTSNRFKRVNIVNLKATWLPNMAIQSKIKDKQKEFPSITYVLDKEKVLVKQWGLKDDSSNILIFDSRGVLIYKHYGRLNKSEIIKVMNLLGVGKGD